MGRTKRQPLACLAEAFYQNRLMPCYLLIGETKHHSGTKSRLLVYRQRDKSVQKTTLQSGAI